MIACEKGLTEIVELLLAKGADINAKNDVSYCLYYPLQFTIETLILILIL